jgi:hypothetical protein
MLFLCVLYVCLYINITISCTWTWTVVEACPNIHRLARSYLCWLDPPEESFKIHLSQREINCVSITQTNWLKLFREIIVVYYENHKKFTYDANILGANCRAYGIWSRQYSVLLDRYSDCDDHLSSEAQQNSGFNFETKNNYFVNKLFIL